MNFKFEKCEKKEYLEIETLENNKDEKLAVIEQAILFIIDEHMTMDNKKVIEEIFHQRGLYDILENAIDEIERGKKHEDNK